MAFDDKAIIAEFVVESREHLADIEQQLLAIETGGANVDIELVNRVFRAVHSIKGAAGFFGFSTTQSLAHELENVLNLIRNLQLVPTSAVTDVLLRAGDKLRALMEDIEHSNEVDIAQYVQELRAVATGGPAAVERDLALIEKLVNESAVEAPPSARRETAVVVPAATERLVEAAPTPHPEPKPVSFAAAAPDANIRVAVRVLDRLMNLAGELVLARNQLLQVVAAKERGNLDSVSARLNHVTSEIQEAIMQTRLQVVDTVFNKFPRVVRQLSQTLGKECELLVEGEDVELDKSIIEAIGDPLTHLIRNSVDHGIEMPEARVKAGKSSKGRIVLKAFHQAGKVNIAVGDDGRGMDPARLKEKALAKGLISSEQARSMSEREALRLIFRPGFSTAEKVTDVSGRGVGMDVVRTNIERLGGTVDVDTRLGAGTTINITLPLTLAIIPSLIVGCGARRFAIPQASISELVRIKAGHAATRIERLNSAEVFRLRGDLLPLVRLSEILDLKRPESRTAAHGVVNIIVVDTGHLRYGLIVEGLYDSEEIVVKPLGKHLKGCSSFAGATILGDGQVALILDTAGIAASSHLAASAAQARDEGDNATCVGDETQNLLLFRYAPDEQFGIPMELVARLERIRSSQVRAIGGRDVLQYRQTALPLLSLEKHIQAGPRPDCDRLYVVVFKVQERELGLLIPELLDIRSAPTQVDTVTFREAGVIGSLVMDGHTMRLLDLFELTQAAHPEWFIQAPAVRADKGRQYRVLLAEDSDFFRKQLAGFLQSEGYEVVACEDGRAAWQTLGESAQPFDLVVTDLEMPHMSGLELTRKIKCDPALARLPVIAVTSLASDEDVERGRKAGVDDYLIKLDRERLADAVRKHIQAAQRACAPSQAAR